MALQNQALHLYRTDDKIRQTNLESAQEQYSLTIAQAHLVVLPRIRAVGRVKASCNLADAVGGERRVGFSRPTDRSAVVLVAPTTPQIDEGRWRSGHDA